VHQIIYYFIIIIFPLYLIGIYWVSQENKNKNKIARHFGEKKTPGGAVGIPFFEMLKRK
jgi:hypothetical protein